MVEAARIHSSLKFRRRELIIKGALVLMAKIIETIRITKLVYNGQLSKLSKEVRAAMAVAAVSRPNLFNAECKGAKILLTIIGVIVWFFALCLYHRDGLWWLKIIPAKFA
jgi:hypothetical protein